MQRFEILHPTSRQSSLHCPTCDLRGTTTAHATTQIKINPRGQGPFAAPSHSLLRTIAVGPIAHEIAYAEVQVLPPPGSQSGLHRAKGEVGSKPGAMGLRGPSLNLTEASPEGSTD